MVEQRDCVLCPMRMYDGGIIPVCILADYRRLTEDWRPPEWCPKNRSNDHDRATSSTAGTGTVVDR